MIIENETVKLTINLQRNVLESLGVKFGFDPNASKRSVNNEVTKVLHKAAGVPLPLTAEELAERAKTMIAAAAANGMDLNDLDSRLDSLIAPTPGTVEDEASDEGAEPAVESEDSDQDEQNPAEVEVDTESEQTEQDDEPQYTGMDFLNTQA